MKVNQIAETLNEVFNEVIGESAVIKEDLSNIVDTGRTVTANLTTISDNDFENYMKKIIDKIGKTIVWDRVYMGDSLGLLRDSWEYGSVLEKIRAEVGEYEETKDWDLANYKPTVFEFTPPSATAKYFNKKVTFTLKNSTTKEQFMSAWTNATAMSRFFSAVENRIKMKSRVAIENLEQRTLNNFIAEKIKSNNNVVNLLADYIAETNDTSINASNALQNKAFLKYVIKTIRLKKKLMNKLSMKYNNDGYPCFTPDEYMLVYALTDLVSELDNTLYSDTYHNEFVKLDGYHELSYWQGSGTTDNINERSKISAIPASEGSLSGVDNRKTIVQTGILFVIADKDAIAVCNENPRTTSIYNPEGEFINYWYKFDASYFNDLGENGIVFLIDDYAILTDEPTDWATNYSNYYTKDNRGLYTALAETTTFIANKYYKKVGNI